MSHLCVNTLPASWQSVYTQMALLGAPYIYDISSLRVKDCNCILNCYVVMCVSST